MKRSGYFSMNLLGMALGAMTLLFSLSIALNQALWTRAKQYYTELNAVRLDPLGLDALDPLVLPPATELTRVVFVGDSRASSWPSPALEGYEFINRGLGSQTSTQVLQRFSAHVAPLNPEVVMLQVGINDLKTIGLFPEQSSAIVADVKANIEHMITQAEEVGAVVVVSSILPAGKISLARRPFWSDDIDAAVVEVNQYLFALAERDDKRIWFDGYAEIVDEHGHVHADYRKDELHLNAKGYEVLNRALVTVLPSVSLVDE